MTPRKDREPHAPGPTLKDGITGVTVYGGATRTVRMFPGLEGGEYVLFDHHGRELAQGDRDDALAWVTGVDY
ncbi:MAG: hypothetical protein M0027_16445 [Candidatus Dormibacteraeota bacterium]|jgi:hypothetical protein|nr:hypothetical protein [Candidatus Dormibacteraeota bacterium]